MAENRKKDDLLQSVRLLSMNVDAVAMELRTSLDDASAAELMDLSVRLCNAADAIEDPSLADGRAPHSRSGHPLSGRSYLIH